MAIIIKQGRHLMDNRHYLLALNRIPQVGPRTINKLLNRWPCLADLFAELAHSGLPPHLVSLLRTVDEKVTECDDIWLDQSANRYILTYDDSRYPALLREIFNPPPLLYAEGELDCLSQPCLAVIGTRFPTVSGLQVAKQFSADLSRSGLTIVSGLAKGIDGAAHEGCLAETGKTIAVLGTGIDKVYPKHHHILVEKIKERGLLLSEFPLQAPPIAGHFPRRNRIISGVSLAVLVVESAVPSGSLLTARLALEQNREVMAVPGSIRNPKVAGCHFLLQQGAKMVTEAKDVLDVFSLEETQKQLIKKAGAEERAGQRILHYMGDEVVTVDQLMVRSGWSMEDIICNLMELEIEGVIQSIPSGFVRCAYER